MEIGFLCCPGTMPGSSRRRADAFEHDMQFGALEPAFARLGLMLREVDWHAPDSAFAGLDMVLLGTAWDYQDDSDAFLSTLERLEQRGIAVCNPPDMVRWNIRKTYLRDLERAGVATIPTLWHESLSREDLLRSFDALDTGTVVVKRQVGAGAEGQELWDRNAALTGFDGLELPVMVQPYLHRIAQTGEISFLFVDGAFSHAVLKRPRDGDYRVQSIYGGTEEIYRPDHTERAAAQAAFDAIPFATPLYARIDMVRGSDDTLLLIEAELIEPFLYPAQGPDLGDRMARAVRQRLTRAPQ